MSAWSIGPSISAGCTRRSASAPARSGGWTEFSAGGQASGRVPAGGMANRLETITPRTASAGWLACQPQTTERRPHWERMFHSALQVRVRVPTGRTPARSGVGSMNPRTPWAYARLPVAMLVHRMGESMGGE